MRPAAESGGWRISTAWRHRGCTGSSWAARPSRTPVLVGEAVLKYGRAIAVGIDAREGRVRTEGWTEASGLDYIEFARKWRGWGSKTLS